MRHKTGARKRVSILLHPADGETTRKEEVPFVVGVLSDFCGVVQTLKDGVELIPSAMAFGAASGMGFGAILLLKTWVDARNGRKLKIKVGDMEVEATQMKEDDVFRIFARLDVMADTKRKLLDEAVEQKKIREILLGLDETNP